MSARILVLEDDSHLRNIMVRVLSHQGFSVASASRAEEAVKLATEEKFDLLIADIRMEGMDGLEAVRLTKEQHPEIGSLIVSGYASEEDTVRAERLQVGGYLKKPFRTGVLLEHVRNLLAEKANAQHRQSQTDIDRDYLIWALHQFLTQADQSSEVGPPGWLGSVMEKANWLTAETGMASQPAQELSLAAGLMAWSRATGESLPEVTHRSRLIRTFQIVFKEQVDSAPLEFALVDLAVTMAEYERDHGVLPSSEQLNEGFPGRFPSQLTEILDRPQKSQTQPADDTVAPNRSGVSLLSLARALERGGDREGAERAYLELSNSQLSTETGVRALLAAGRLANLCGRPEQALERIEKAGREAPKLGPTIHALAQLELGLQLAQTERVSESIDSLSQAVAYLASLELWVDWVDGILALSRLGENIDQSSLARLVTLSKRSGAYLFESRFLPNLKAVLLLYSKQVLKEASPLAALVQYAPRRLERVLPELSGKEKAALCQGLVEGEQACPEELIRVLLSDSEREVRELAGKLRSSSSEVLLAQTIRIFSQGVFQVFRGEDRVPDLDFKTQKNRYLLAYLASDGGRARPVEPLVEMFWPGKGQKGKNCLNWAVSTLRSLFRTPSSNVIIRDADKLFLDPSVPRWHDLDELEEAIKDARKAEQEGQKNKAWQHFRRAAELYRGEYLEGCYMDWALQRRTRISNVMADCYWRLAELSEAAEQMAEAETAINQLLTIQPHSQKGHLFKIEHLTRRGQPERAIEHYRRCEELLRLEYGLEPTIDIVRAYHTARLAL